MGLHHRGAAKGWLDSAPAYRAAVFPWTSDMAAPPGEGAGSIACNGNLHNSFHEKAGECTRTLYTTPSMRRPVSVRERCFSGLNRAHCGMHDQKLELGHYARSSLLPACRGDDHNSRADVGRPS